MNLRDMRSSAMDSQLQFVHDHRQGGRTCGLCSQYGLSQGDRAGLPVEFIQDLLHFFSLEASFGSDDEGDLAALL